MDNVYLKKFVEFVISSGLLKNKGEFAEKMNYTRSYTSELMNGYTTITPDFERKFKLTFKKELELFKSYEEDNVYINEKNTVYNSCPDCKAKNVIIESLKATLLAQEETIKVQKALIAFYQKTSSDKSEN